MFTDGDLSLPSPRPRHLGVSSQQDSVSLPSNITTRQRGRQTDMLQDKMISSDEIPPELAVEENVTRLIKEEPRTEELDKMIEFDQISPEPGVKEDISRLIKEEPLTEKICTKDDPDDIKIEQDVTAMIVPKDEKKKSCSESHESFGRNANRRARDELVDDHITGSLRNSASCATTEDLALYSQRSAEERLHPPSLLAVPHETRESSSRASISRMTSMRRYNRDIINDEQFLFDCKPCSRSFTSYKGLQVHKAYCRHGPKTCCCDELGITCSFESSSFIRQEHSLNSSLPFRCCVCGKYFRLKKRLKVHMVIHSNVKPYHCDECSRGFRRRKNLLSHMVMHSDAWSFTCIVCCKVFRRRNTLRQHMTVHHSNERPYTCNDCGRAFKYPTLLSKHVNIHSKIALYTCSMCPRAFKNRKALFDHKCIAHSGKNQYTCNECSQTYRFRKALIRHLAIHNKAK